MLSGLKGERAIIGGASPAVLLLPREFLDTGRVIGLNRWPAQFDRCDYWLGLDTGVNCRKWFLDDPKWPDEPKFLRSLDCPLFMRAPNPDTERIEMPSGVVLFDRKPADIVPLDWPPGERLRLAWASSSAMAAISLAIIGGAREVVLFGVDFVGDGRADGTRYNKPDFWAPHRNAINTIMAAFQRHVPIYKTSPYGWLDCQYVDITEEIPACLTP